MKKTIKSLLAIAVAALTFHSCADVPEPYQIPDGGGSGGNLPEGTIFKQVFSSDKGDFIIKNLSMAEGLSGSDIWTTGASYLKATTYLQLSGETAKKNHNADSWFISPRFSLKDMTTAYVILNHSTGYLNGAKPATCLKVMVSDNYTDGAAINVDDWKDIEIDNWYTGTSFEFVDGNGDLKDFIGKENVHVALRYIGTESTSPTWEIASLTIADTPQKAEEKQMPTDLTGKGTPEEPYTVADAHKIIDVFGSSESPEVYVKGKVVSREFSSQHSSMTYFISDDGTTNGQLEVYGGKYFNKQGFTSESQLNVGDEVIVVGKLVNYQGKTREFTNGNYIYMLNGETDGGEVEPQPQPVDPTGENLLANGDFELWTGGLPDNWKSSTTASNATLSQSTDAHTGSYAVKIAHDASANKRMAYKEITLKAGTYLLTFYVKGSDGTTSVRPGYTNILENGKANSTYTYGDYVNDITTEWQLVNHTFTLANETKLNLVIMVPKNAASDPLIDDVTLTTSDGGLADGGQTEPVDPSVDPQPTSGFEAGKYFMVFKSGNTYKVAKPIDEASVKKGYGYIYMEDATLDNGVLSSSEANLFTFSAVTGGYAIQDSNNVYYYSKGTYKSFQLATTVPSDLGAWTVEINANGTASIKHSVTGFGIFHTVYQSKDELQPTTTGDNVYLVKQGERITF